ncbi:ribosomal RNA small subunit methyltransferase A [Lujinxingia litoralis]|uniref:Ribosomal RNA small subunit methyltransferase A n=1 Tax=Lujinxingia litoralis TaxID=2211119 RepID=A0A328C6B9_9DELT|nr:16S rRNA (adenine(1518)-N(6)/adenine(1519)-N(6))-dimethyltransferase RsmA [Lujinxingia litoralis]RAL21673.1 ribosomal RNA small subunit methyltransferase A [Lujinxingia litoralis]
MVDQHDKHPLQALSPGDLLRSFGQRTKKQFGQHFLVDPRILGEIARLGKVAPGDHVLEVGPGCGTLTLTMLQAGATVDAIEIDRDAVAFLQESLAEDWGFKLHAGDALKADIAGILASRAGTWKAVANLPYNVGTEVTFRLFEQRERLQRMTLMYQREVAQRMVAREGDDAYGALSVMVRLYADAELVMHLPPGAFVPPPKVHSSVVNFELLPETRIEDEARREFFVKVVKSAFQVRRKTLPNGLKALKLPRERVISAIESAGLSPKVRPERVGFEAFLAVADALRQG